MIIDTSALVAIAYREAGFETLRRAIRENRSRIPAPVVVEYTRVTNQRGSRRDREAEALLDFLTSNGTEVEPFTSEDAALARRANADHGVGNGRGGTLNLLDLMVYAVARRLAMPILCTGGDFAAAGAMLHPASRS